MNNRINKLNSKGITLVALVVTIVVLLILAGITITMLFSENGIIKKAQQAKEDTELAQGNDLNGMNDLSNQMSNALKEDGTSESKSSLEKLAESGTFITEEKKDVKDKYNNTVSVPKGFKVIEASEGEEITVQKGVVIEDKDGNQFVWIPVGNVNVIENGESKTKEIKLGRYTFNETTGEKVEVQLAYTDENQPNYINTDGTVGVISVGTEALIDNITELSTARTGVASSGTDGLNATAKDLKGFVDSVRINGGYYLARYEAGCEVKEGESGNICKLVSKLSKTNARNDTFVKPTTVGDIKLWNGITQLEASAECRNMYNLSDNVGVESDLVNGYAWDTAIVYVQEMGNANFANKKYSDVGSKTSLANTGSNTSDKFCNIYDMVANAYEWTTEYSDNKNAQYANPCVLRGGMYDRDYTSFRSGSSATNSGSYFSFRTVLYIKK